MWELLKGEAKRKELKENKRWVGGTRGKDGTGEKKKKGRKKKFSKHGYLNDFQIGKFLKHEHAIIS